jgi:hypothetical protein
VSYLIRLDHDDAFESNRLGRKHGRLAIFIESALAKGSGRSLPVVLPKSKLANHTPRKKINSSGSRNIRGRISTGIYSPQRPGRNFLFFFFWRLFVLATKNHLRASLMKIVHFAIFQLLESVNHVLSESLYESLAPESIVEILPDALNQKLKILIAKIITHHLPTWRKEAIATQVALPRLQAVDWRLDLKNSCDQAPRISGPALFVQLKVCYFCFESVSKLEKYSNKSVFRGDTTKFDFLILIPRCF